jgi:flagellar hook-associated protein 2
VSAVSGSSSTTPSTVTTDLTTGSNGVSTFNISGLASGLDDNQIITELMSIASLPETNIKNQITLETTRQSDIQGIQTQLASLSTAIAELVDPSTWSTSQQISSSDPTNVSATGGGVPPGGFEVSVQQLARAAQMTQTSSMTAASGDDQLQIQIGSGNAFNVNIHSGDSLQTIANEINSSAGTQLFASVINSKLTLSSEQTGSANTISVSSVGGGTVASDLGLAQTVAPRDAIYSLDGGAPTTSASNTITSIATGLTVTLHGITTNPATITVAQAGPNTSGVETALQDFVTAYNATVTAVSNKVNEQKVVNPSTDADRAQGDLNGDPGLESLLTQLREAVGDVFGGAPGGMSVLSQAGLSTGAAVGSGALNQDSIDGFLTLDTNKLESQLTAQFQNVKNLFTNPTKSYSTQGLAQRLNGIMAQFTGTKGVLNSEIQGQSSLIASLNQQKSEWDVRLASQQTALQTKFANMETALSQLQSQGSWLSSSIAKLSANS